ncbi:hypothetical protein TNCV_134961 [Trichonephila clavipes]|nr:hypothetical protein TNCV_134961 [Trichonephila clavipes]
MMVTTGWSVQRVVVYLCRFDLTVKQVLKPLEKRKVWYPEARMPFINQQSRRPSYHTTRMHSAICPLPAISCICSTYIARLCGSPYYSRPQD